MVGRFVLILIAVMAAPTVAVAAERGDARVTAKYRVHPAHRAETALPYPWSRRSAKIRYADRCWRACLADAGRDLQACLRVADPNDCVPWNDVADRSCLRECRLSGGPWVNVE